MAPVLPARARAAWIWAVGLLAAGLATLAHHTLRRQPPPAAPATQVVQQSAPVPDAPPLPAAGRAANVRDTLAGLSPRELFQRWLDAGRLAGRLAAVTLNLAEDESPAGELEFLRPSRRFSASRAGRELVISPRSAARYDAFTNVVSSLDGRRVAAAYRTLHPLLESACHALGYPGHPLDRAVTRALQRIIDAPVREEVALKQVGALYLFADDRLEAQGPVEKHLLRMGARNTRLLQAEAREIGTALGLPLRGEPQASTLR